MSCHKGPLKAGLVFILFTFLSLYSAYDIGIVKFMPFLTLYIMRALIIYPYKSHITGLLLNSLFQMSWLYCFALLTGSNFTLLGFIFFAYHIPILFLNTINMKVRVILLILSSIGGIVIAFLLIIPTYPYSLLAGILLHFLTYFVFLVPLDSKYKIGIIN